MDKNWWMAPTAALLALVLCVLAGLWNAGLL